MAIIIPLLKLQKLCVLASRDLYKFMQATQRDSNNNNKGGKSSSKQGKGTENFSSEQVKQAQDDYNEEATLFVFRLKSLKQGQFRSLLTQAIRHHAAQVYFSNILLHVCVMHGWLVVPIYHVSLFLTARFSLFICCFMLSCAYCTGTCWCLWFYRALSPPPPPHLILHLCVLTSN
jgi:hypothetical protein